MERVKRNFVEFHTLTKIASDEKIVKKYQGEEFKDGKDSSSKGIDGQRVKAHPDWQREY